VTERMSPFTQQKLFIKIPTQMWNEQVASPYHLSPIRVPAFLWNAQTSPTSLPYPATTEESTTSFNPPHDIAERSQLARSGARKPMPRTPGKLAHWNASAPVPYFKKEETAWPATRCKTPLYRFNPNHARNEMRLETPCLQSTCKSCVKWHPQLIQEPAWPVERPAVEPLSPIIDPRLLKPWTGAVDEERRASNVSVLELPDPVTQPVHAYTEQNADGDTQPSLQLQLPTRQKYNLFLPSKLVDCTTSRPASANSLWRTSPRQRYTVILPFRTQASQSRFADRVARTRSREEGEGVKGILKAGGHILGKRARDAVIGAGENVCEETKAKRVRFRHRIRLVFGSVEGKRQFGEAVEGRGLGG
jgi:hypothetical protein